jgi:hypothetical protein
VKTSFQKLSRRMEQLPCGNRYARSNSLLTCDLGWRDYFNTWRQPGCCVGVAVEKIRLAVASKTP